MMVRVCILLLLVAAAAQSEEFSLPLLQLSAPPPDTSGETSPPPEAQGAVPPFFSINEPLWHENQRVSALPRPFFVHFRDGDTDSSGIDSLWPLIVHRDRPWRHHTRLLLAYNSGEQLPGDGDPQSRWGLFPFLWGGKVPDKGRYFALFPLGGYLHDVAGYDHIRFALFPLYLNTVRVNRHQHSLLWPVFALTRESGDLRKWRIFPLAGGAHKSGGYQYFALWPLLHAKHAETPGGRLRNGYAFLPFYGQLTETDSDSGEQTFWARTVLWPFFSAAAGHGIRRLHLPWPFYQYKTVRKKGKLSYRKEYFWPVFGSRVRPDDRYHFAAWPFYHRWLVQSDEKTLRKRRYVLPFYWSSVVEREGKVTQLYQLFWPLLRRERYGQQARTSALALWPHRNAIPIRRNYAPFWTVYSRTEDAQGHEVSAFWRLWQYEEHNLESPADAAEQPVKRARFRLAFLLDARREGDRYSVSVLKGLLKVTNAKEKRNRLLWLIPW